MEGTNSNKGGQANNRRFIKNRRDNSSFNPPARHQEHSPNSQVGKINSVKPRYSSVDQNKASPTKPEIVALKQDDGNEQEIKSNFKKKDFHGVKDGQFHAHHAQKENKNYVKYDDRRFRTNTRHYKPASRNQFKQHETQRNEGSSPRKLPNRTETVLLKKNDNGSNVNTKPKPAVHVQPLPQVAEKTAVQRTVEQTLTTRDPREPTSNEAVIQTYQNESSVDCNQKASTERSLSQQKFPEQTKPIMVQTAPREVPAAVQTTGRSKQDFHQKSLPENPLNDIKAGLPNEARSLADLNTSVLGDYLSSSICSSFVPQQGMLEPQSKLQATQNLLMPPQVQGQTNSDSMELRTEQHLVRPDNKGQETHSHVVQENVKEPLCGHSQDSFQIQRSELEEAASLPSVPDEKYGYRISVDSLFSTSFFKSPQTDIKDAIAGTSDSLHANHVFEKPKDSETLELSNQVFHMNEAQQGHRNQFLNPQFVQQCAINPSNTLKNISMVKNEKRNEALFVPNKLQQDQLINGAQPLTLANPKTVALNNHLVENQKFNEATVLANSVPQHLNEPQQFDAGIPRTKMYNPPLLDYQQLAHSQSTFMKDENIDVSPRGSKDQPTLGSPPTVLRTFNENPANLVTNTSFSVDNSITRPCVNFTEQPKDGKEKIPAVKMSEFTRDDSSSCLGADVKTKKEVVNDEAQLDNAQPMAKPEVIKTNPDAEAEALVNRNYREIPKQPASLQTNRFPAHETNKNASCSTAANNLSQSTNVELRDPPKISGKESYRKSEPLLMNEAIEENQLHQGTFPHAPFLPNPFLGHSLLTHRQAIPSAFVFPSRVGLPGGHSGFTDVAGNNPGSHIFLAHGTTVCLNVGGRIFEILPSTFAPYPESLLCQIFTGAAPTPINQRGHIFFDRDGYLFEVILAFARVGHFTFPPNVNLSSLMNEARFFGMYDYMFLKGQVSSRHMLQFQRTTRCTLHCDESDKASDTREFVLQGEDKLKIESLRVTGPCCLYVDLYTPLGVKETSNFVVYTPDKPDLWKAYQFCAERQLVFHLQRASADASVKSSVDIVFAQTFMFTEDEFVFNL